jgi:hypothetical protein
MFFGWTVLILGLVAIPVKEAGALESITCRFAWVDNEELNVEAGAESVTKNVRGREYDRLVQQGCVRVRVAAERGSHCQLNHPENTRIDVRITKADHMLHAAGHVPYCADLNAYVRCPSEGESPCPPQEDSTNDPARWGIAGDLPIVGQFERNGDRREDRAVFRPSTREWFFNYEWDNRTNRRHSDWGLPGDLPITGDFDTDGQRDDIAVFRPSTRTWYYDFDSDGTTNDQKGDWGHPGDLPISGDFDRDGQYDDVGVFRASNKMVYVDFDHDGSKDAEFTSMYSPQLPEDPERCHPVVFDETHLEYMVYIFCNGTWHHPGS